ncbi:MAG: hypothetical protein E7447_01755 [Ruminococcaceae bacterium]|nr:hypothetical protein [Oscillospiraceae bacterium]
MFKKYKNPIAILCFLVVEAILYYFILTAGGDFLRYSSYVSIIVCFAFALVMGFRKNPLIVGGLLCTVGADFCLVMCQPIQQLWGMVFFLGAQMLYAIHLHKKQSSTPLLIGRLALTAAGVGIAILVLQDKTDALALVSICYYANLIMNLIVACTQWKSGKLLPIGFALFILCDTVIGLQVASGGYLPIPEDSALHNLLFMPFNLSWFFYLPSQVLIALSSLTKGTRNEKENEKK